jgi:hypothetical protein
LHSHQERIAVFTEGEGFTADSENRAKHTKNEKDGHSGRMSHSPRTPNSRGEMQLPARSVIERWTLGVECSALNVRRSMFGICSSKADPPNKRSPDEFSSSSGLLSLEF